MPSLDFPFEFEQVVDGHAVGSIQGVAEVHGHALCWHVEKIRLTGARFEDGRSVWRDVPLPAVHYLHPVVLAYLHVDRSEAIDQALYDAGHRGYGADNERHLQHEMI